MMRLLPQPLDKVRYVTTINLFVLPSNALKLIPYTALGQLSLDNLLLSLALALIVLLASGQLIYSMNAAHTTAPRRQACGAHRRKGVGSQPGRLPVAFS